MLKPEFLGDRWIVAPDWDSDFAVMSVPEALSLYAFETEAEAWAWIHGYQAANCAG